MPDVSSTYLGLDLKNPIMAGSCGLTGNLDEVRKLADGGVGAIVLKSLFEEQILNELSSNLESYQTDYPDAYDYVRDYTRGNIVGDYLRLIGEAKKAVAVPVIASINCVTSNEWVNFASSVEKAGADALEINVSLLPADPRKTSKQYEQVYFEILDAVSDKVKIPVALKMSSYSPALANLIARLSWTEKVKGFVLFNRYASPDIDIDREEVVTAPIYSLREEAILPLRWIALLSGEINCDFAASTGVHDAKGLIKQLLAGAAAVQVASTLYQHGPAQVGRMVEGLQEWMVSKGYSEISEFRGKLRYGRSHNPAMYERIQFMRQFSGIK